MANKILYGTIDGSTYGFFPEMLRNSMKSVNAELTMDEHLELVKSANTSGKIIVPGEDGTPTLSDPVVEQKDVNIARINELKTYLNDTDYIVIKIAEGSATKDDYAEILSKRQAARKEIGELEQSI